MIVLIDCGISGQLSALYNQCHVARGLIYESWPSVELLGTSNIYISLCDVLAKKQVMPSFLEILIHLLTTEHFRSHNSFSTHVFLNNFVVLTNISSVISKNL